VLPRLIWRQLALAALLCSALPLCTATGKGARRRGASPMRAAAAATKFTGGAKAGGGAGLLSDADEDEEEDRWVPFHFVSAFNYSTHSRMTVSRLTQPPKQGRARLQACDSGVRVQLAGRSDRPAGPVCVSLCSVHG
jgi:hypothetical protein